MVQLRAGASKHRRLCSKKWPQFQGACCCQSLTARNKVLSQWLFSHRSLTSWATTKSEMKILCLESSSKVSWSPELGQKLRLIATQNDAVREVAEPLNLSQEPWDQVFCICTCICICICICISICIWSVLSGATRAGLEVPVTWCRVQRSCATRKPRWRNGRTTGSYFVLVCGHQLVKIRWNTSCHWHCHWLWLGHNLWPLSVGQDLVRQLIVLSVST